MEKITKGTEQHKEFIHRKIDEFNISQVPYEKEKIWEDLNRYAFNEEGKILGGITASLIMNSCLSIHVLWVDESMRSNGLGSRLMKAIESEAIQAGAVMAHVDTFDFQALGFYEKNGYEIFGILDGSPCVGHKRFYLRKSLID